MTRFAPDPLLDALQTRLREMALEARASTNKGQIKDDALSVDVEVQIAQAEIFWAINDERRSRLPPRYERRRSIRAWEVGSGELFDEDQAARLARMCSLRLGIRSRRHSKDEAFEASRGIKFRDLPTIERRAVEIVLRRRRAARNNPTDPASRIANYVRREWFQKVPPVGRKKTEGISLYEMHCIPIPVPLIVRVAVPILDRLAGKPMPSGIPTSCDPRTIKNAGMAALFAIVQMECGRIPIDTVYRALLKFRRGRGDTTQHIDS
jgi:hypothetical protein